MQEEVDEKTVALAINGGRISADILKAALGKLVRDMEEKNRISESTRREEKKAEKKEAREAKTVAKKQEYRPGKKSLNSRVKQGSKLSNVEIKDGNIRSFEKVARKYSIEYSLKKDRSQTPPRYLVFFRAKDKGVMMAAFKEYSNLSIPESRKASIRKRLRSAIERSAQHRERAKVREKEREPSR